MTVFEYVTDIITSLGILIAVITLFINFRNNYLLVMHKCIKEYRDIVRKIQCKEYANEEIAKKDLLGLFNEQLYYFGKWYLPRDIKKEWKTTMIRHLTNKDKDIKSFKKEDWKDFERVSDFMSKIDK